MDDRRALTEAIFNNFQSIRRTFSHQGSGLQREYGVTMSQSFLLFLIYRDGPMSVGSIAGTLGVSVSAATQMIDGIEKRGLLTRSESQADRRVQNIELTPEGKKLLKAIRQTAFDDMYRVFEVLDNSELERLERITHKLLASKEDDAC